MLKRLNSLLIAFVFMFTVLVGRCGYIAFSDNYTVSDSYNSYTISIGELYTNIYDRNGRKLNNNYSQTVAVIPPDEKAISELELLFDSDEISLICDELSKGYPVTRIVENKADTKYVKQYKKIIENSDDMLAKNIIDSNYGGLEQYVQEKIGELSVNFGVNALGEILSGDSIEVVDDNYSSNEGIKISIDSDIQRIAENSATSISKGAVVVLDVATSQILASVSKGNDYVNRALSAYSVGSVFKLVVSACALENNINPLYNCTGSITVGDTTFNCQNSKAHGLQNMRDGLKNSCNCYFVNLALKLGAEKIYNTAKSLGFGDTYNIYDGWSCSVGNFPNTDVLNNSKGQLALIGFGQGLLTDSPMHFASVVACIANGGNYKFPTLSLDETDNNNVLSASTCKTLQEYMHNVVVNGTGTNANYNNMTAGKTATAQSGTFVDGKEILYTWFAGFYPYDNPKYAIVVMQEDGTSGSENCCPVFRAIVEKLENM